MQWVLKDVNLSVDFLLILSFNFLAFSHGETRNYSFKRETIKFTQVLFDL